MVASNLPIEVQASLSDGEYVKEVVSRNRKSYILDTFVSLSIKYLFVFGILLGISVITIEYTDSNLYSELALGVLATVFVFLFHIGMKSFSQVRIVLTNHRLFIHKHSVLNSSDMKYASLDGFVSLWISRGFFERVFDTVTLKFKTKRDTATLSSAGHIPKSKINLLVEEVDGSESISFEEDSDMALSQLVLWKDEEISVVEQADFSYRFWEGIASPTRFLISLTLLVGVVITFSLWGSLIPVFGSILYFEAFVAGAIVLILYLPVGLRLLDTGVYVITDDRVVSYEKMGGTETVTVIHKDHIQELSMNWSYFQEKKEIITLNIDAMRGSESVEFHGVPQDRVELFVSESLGDSKVIRPKGVLR